MRLTRAWKAFALVCMTIATIVILSSCSGDSKDISATASSPDQFSSLAQAHNYAGALFSKPINKFNGTLIDTNNASFNIANQTKGNVTLVYFGYTHCPDACPIAMGTLAGVKRQMPADVSKDLKVIFITVDPQRDTPNVLKEWLAKFDSSFIGLTGSAEQIKAAAIAYGIPYEKIDKATPEQLDYFVDHFSGIFVYSSDNMAHLLYPAEGITVDIWARDITRLAKEGFQP